jgi:PAS domain S-box-containing protein
MKDEHKTKEQLIAELEKLRQQVTEIEATETKRIGVEKALKPAEEEALRLSQSELQARNKSLEAINTIADRLHRSLDLRTIVEQAVDSMMEYSQSPSVGIFAVNEQSNCLELLHARGFGEETLQIAARMPLEGSLTGLAVKRKEVITSEDMQSDDRLYAAGHKTLTDEGFRSAISVPLVSGNKALGAMNLIFREEPRLTDYEQETLITIGKTIGLAMANAQYVSQIQTAVADRESAEEALKASEERYALATRAAKVGVWDINMKTGEFYLDPNVKALLGYSDEEVSNDLDVWVTYVHPEDKQPVMEAFQQHLEGKTPKFVYEHRMLHKDGSNRWILVRGTAIRDAEGNVVRVVGTDSDITARKQAEEEQARLQSELLQVQKMEAIGTLAGGIAHDFNNLLQVIKGYGDLLLLNKKRDDPAYRQLREITEAAKRGSELTRQLLTFGRKVESELRPVDLNLEVGKATRLLERTIPKMINIELNLSGELKVVNADPIQIEQVLVNLAINARDAIEGEGKLSIRTANVCLDEEDCRTNPEAQPGEYVVLEVSDTGRGMDTETQNHIFEPFYTTKGFAEGSGLGLAMVYGIIKGHDGFIACSSELGVGTTFEIYLPAIEQELESQIAAEAKMPQGGTETILLVDDEDFIRLQGEQTLTTFGYKVLTAPDAESALEIYRKDQEQIDLIILDLIMPGMGGRRCIDELLKINPKAKVIVASGYSDVGPMKRTLEAGAKGFMGKPYGIRHMLEVVREVLD